LINRKYQELESSKNKLKNGLTKLKEANDIIDNLKVELTNLQPILDKKTIEIELLIERLNVDRQEANKVKAIVQDEEALVGEQAASIKEVKDDADKVL
jgi:dynein heavy chain